MSAGRSPAAGSGAIASGTLVGGELGVEVAARRAAAEAEAEADDNADAEDSAEADTDDDDEDDDDEEAEDEDEADEAESRRPLSASGDSSELPAGNSSWWLRRCWWLWWLWLFIGELLALTAWLLLPPPPPPPGCVSAEAAAAAAAAAADGVKLSICICWAVAWASDSTSRWCSKMCGGNGFAVRPSCGLNLRRAFGVCNFGFGFDE